MSYFQSIITLPAFNRGLHIVTPQIATAISEIMTSQTRQTGLVHLFLQHTSASLTINENADPDVRLDTEDWLNQIAPANQPQYRHILEGEDDLPAHFKNMLLGSSLTLPLVNGKLGLGTWQGIYLCEHRNHASGRNLVITIAI